MKIGANYIGNERCEFVVWAPFLNKVELKIIPPIGAPLHIPMERDDNGYWKSVVEGIPPGTLYFYRLEEERERPDPASYFQPQGVHGPSQVVDHRSFNWSDDGWTGITLSKMIIYEIHVGTFTTEGKFVSIIPRLDELLDLGVNAIEIMPVAQFPGERNWGYDGVCLFAVQNSYSGPEGLKTLVNECHKKGMAVVLDVVYNHFGPEGNYLSEFGPYFTDKYKTPWGRAINFDESYSDDVRNFFIENALYWFKNYHIDTLRLDAIHTIFDMSAKPFLEELSERVEGFSKEEGRKFYLIAESDLNDARVIRPRGLGGYEMDAQWSDDLHHSIHVLLTGEDSGYYADFGRVEDLVKSLNDGFVYSGQYSRYRKRRHGNSSKDRPAEQFVVFSQNHDQIGNRMMGERLSSLIPFEGLKLSAGVVFLSPYIPLIFMGEEYGEKSPFLYFVSHSDPDLIEAVRRGRKEEFMSFNWKGEPPDPQSMDTFLMSKLNWEKRKEGNHKVLLDFYKNLIALRKNVPALSSLDKNNLEVSGFEKERVIFMRRWKDGSYIFSIFNFNRSEIRVRIPTHGGEWRKILDSSEEIWGGPGTSLPEVLVSGGEMDIKGLSLVVYEGFV
ncbi:MAG: malto-oligosyltrehalose trehalohydrolase [Candidatus Dadabacteria bacterium]